MSTKLILATFAVLAAFLSFDITPRPQDEKKPGGPPALPTQDEMKKMMEMYEKAAVVGEPHKFLAKLVGKWTSVMKTESMPGMPGEQSAGTSETRSILGGRQVVLTSQGTMMGKPFNSFMVIGYDNVTKEFVATNCDDLSTGQYQTRGQLDASGKILELKGEMRDAMTPDKGRPWRMVFTIESDDKHVLEIYDTITPGQEMKVVTVTISRAK